MSDASDGTKFISAGHVILVIHTDHDTKWIQGQCSRSAKLSTGDANKANVAMEGDVSLR